jgi:hypothetical protein
MTDQHTHAVPHAHEHEHDGDSHVHPHTTHVHNHVEHEHQHEHAGETHTHAHVHQDGIEAAHEHAPEVAVSTSRAGFPRPRRVGWPAWARAAHHPTQEHSVLKLIRVSCNCMRASKLGQHRWSVR